MGHQRFNFLLSSTENKYPTIEEWEDCLDRHLGIKTTWRLEKKQAPSLHLYPTGTIHGFENYRIGYNDIANNDISFSRSDYCIALTKVIWPLDYLTQVLLFLVASKAADIDVFHYWQHNWILYNSKQCYSYFAKPPLLLDACDLDIFFKNKWEWSEYDLERIKSPYHKAKLMDGFSEDYTGNYGL